MTQPTPRVPTFSTRVRLIRSGIPAPTPQLDVCDLDGRWIARVDFGWEQFRLIVECDGFEFHGSREAFERDRRRWAELTRAGWRVIVVTWRAVMNDPNYLVKLVADLIAA